MIRYCLFFLSVAGPGLLAMEGPVKKTYNHVPSLKILAAQKVYELGLVGNDIEQIVYENVMFEEYTRMPNYIVEEYKQRKLAGIQRDNSIVSPDKRVKERIYTYNVLSHMNRR